MTVHEIQEEILRLKKEKDICILAHAYQKQSIQRPGRENLKPGGDHVRRPLYGGNLQDLITGQEGMVGQPHGRMSYGRAAWS